MNFHCNGYVRADTAKAGKGAITALDEFYRQQTLLPDEKDGPESVEVFTRVPFEEDLGKLNSSILEQMAWALLSRPGYDMLVLPLHVSVKAHINGIADHPGMSYVQQVLNTGYVAVSKQKGILNQPDRALPDPEVRTAFFLHAALDTTASFPYSVFNMSSGQNLRQRLVNEIKRKLPARLKVRLVQIYHGMMLLAGRNDLVAQYGEDTLLPRKRQWASAYPVLNIQSRPRDIQNRIPVLIAMHWLELGGAEKFAVDLIKNLPKEKYAVYVTTDVPSANTWAREVQAYVEEIWQLPVLLPRNMVSVFYKEFIDSRNIQLLHIHHAVRAYESLFYIRRFFPELVVLDSLHIIEMPPNTGGFPESSGRDLSPLMDHHHVISDLLKQFMIQRWQVPETKVTLTYLNVDPDYFNPDITPAGVVRSKFDIRDDTILIGFIGRFVDQKQPLVFVETAREIRDRIKKEYKDNAVCFVMVGSGPLAGQIEKKIRQYGMEGQFFLHPEVRDTRPVYKDIDLLVMPSENEGLALVSYEAMAMKVPVLFSDVGAQFELQESRFLVPPGAGEAQSFADKAIQLIQDKNELRQTGENLRSYILKNHRASDTFKALNLLYDRLLRTSDKKQGEKKL